MYAVSGIPVEMLSQPPVTKLQQRPCKYLQAEVLALMLSTCALSLACCLPSSQALREAIAALYERLQPEQLVVCVPEEGVL